jgi:spoIIIJ-associated protein
MKDRIFTGSDVDEALASAAASLGLPLRELRYVVLDQGSAGARGLSPTPARIAILIQDAARAGSHPAPPAARPHREDAARRRDERGSAPAGPVRVDPHEGIREVVRALAEAGPLALDVDLRDDDEALVVQMRGEGAAFFHGEDADGEPLRALEHLLHRMYAPALHPRTLRLRCEGYREKRDLALAARARRLAEEVRADGQPRSFEPQNAYERRIVHMTLQDEPGIQTYSVGEGGARRVTLAPRALEAAGGDDDGRAGE